MALSSTILALLVCVCGGGEVVFASFIFREYKLRSYMAMPWACDPQYMYRYFVTVPKFINRYRRTALLQYRFTCTSTACHTVIGQAELGLGNPWLLAQSSQLQATVRLAAAEQRAQRANTKERTRRVLQSGTESWHPLERN